MTNDYVVKAHIGYDLQDAAEGLAELIEMLTQSPDINEDDFKGTFAHLYWHLNSAWNCRNLSPEELEYADHDQQNKWGEFPRDLKPL